MHTTTHSYTAPQTPDSAHKGWVGKLHMEFALSQGRTVLKHRRQMGPLATQRPLYPEGGICHTYIIHPPGGVVGGDVLDISCHVAPNAHALLTTPGATKFYLSDGRIATQKQHLHIAPNGLLEYLPQENIFFKGCHVQMQTDIRCADGGHFMVWEWNCFGRPANAQAYTNGTIRGHTRIFMGDTVVLQERMSYDGTDTLMRVVGLQNYPMHATLYISTPPTTPDVLKTIRMGIQDANIPTHTGVCSVTQLDNVIVVRMFARWAETIKIHFSHIWQAVRYARHQTHATIPRIWNT